MQREPSRPDAAIQSLLDQSVAAVYIVDLEQRFVHINAHFAELCGYSQAEMIGHHVTEFVADYDVEARRAAFARVASGEVSSLQNVVAFRRKDGEVLELLAQSTLASFDGAAAIIGVATDISARSRAEKALERANRALRTLSAGNSALIRARSEPELLQTMCDIALTTGAYSTAWVAVAQHNAEKTVAPIARAGSGADDLDTLDVRWDDSERGRGPTGTAIRTGEPAVYRDMENDPRFRPWRDQYTRHNIKSIISLPLRDAAGVFGALTLYAADPLAFDEEEVALLVELADDISYGVVALRNGTALRAAERRSREYATRLEALWKVVNNPRLSGDELWQAMLAEAVAVIRPGEPYVGALFRLEGPELYVEAVAESPEYAATAGGPFALVVAGRLPLPGTGVEALLAGVRGTSSWDDLASAFPVPFIRGNAAWCSSIATTFDSGPSTYVLWFASTAATGPWEPQDHAYVGVLASFFASQAQLRWQFERIQHQQTHDALTNLLNRSQFRAQARLASASGGSYAVVALNLNDFGAVNEAYGSMIGDALLVEVAAALLERTMPGEIVGRLGGDAFGVFVPNPLSTEFVRERATAFAERFGNPFSTGDRDGKDFVPLTASFGIAIAPEHGTTIDNIISHANLAVDAARARGRGTVALYEPTMIER